MAYKSTETTPSGLPLVTPVELNKRAEGGVWSGMTQRNAAVDGTFAQIQNAPSRKPTGERRKSK